MQITEVHYTKFKCHDGEEFDTREAAEHHERVCALAVSIRGAADGDELPASVDSYGDTLADWLLKNYDIVPKGSVQKKPVISDQWLRDKWQQAGGGFHGPHIETATMPEKALFAFLRGLL